MNALLPSPFTLCALVIPHLVFAIGLSSCVSDPSREPQTDSVDLQALNELDSQSLESTQDQNTVTNDKLNSESDSQLSSESDSQLSSASDPESNAKTQSPSSNKSESESESGLSSESVEVTTAIADAFEPCTLDVSKVDSSCSGPDSSQCDGVDIAQNYDMWPNPYECFVCGDGVTLLKGSACENQGVELVWNDTAEQCILNGQGYPITESHTCSNGEYDDGITPEAFQDLAADWYKIATQVGTPVYQAAAGADTYVVDFTLEDGETIEAAVSMGHGALDGKCGATFLVKVDSKYVLLLQTDVRSWSLELSPGANTWLDNSNVGGTCIIPEVRRIDTDFVLEQLL